MRIIGKVKICVLTAVIASINGNASDSKNCTQAEKIYYGTYKFWECRAKSIYGYSLSKSHAHEKMCEHEKKLLKESDPDNYKANRNCSLDNERAGPSGYSTSCDNLRFNAQVCGSHYDMCHSAEEKKLIMKMWIKQFLRETIYQVGRYEDNSLELKNGNCNHILEEYFDKEEIKEISDMIGSPDVKYQLERGINYGLNVTIKPMGVLAAANMDGSRISIAGSSKYLTNKTAMIRALTLPSHWKYCDWKLTQTYGPRRYQYTNLPYRLPDFWHCDGKCNTNEGDNQAWYLGYAFQMIGGRGPGYHDLEDGEYKFEEYVDDLIEDKEAENIADKGIMGCFTDTIQRIRELWDVSQTQFNPKADDCDKYQNFVQHCLEPIDRCLGNVAIREVVVSALVRHFKPGQCWEKDSGNNLVSSLVLTMLCILFLRHMYSPY